MIVNLKSAREMKPNNLNKGKILLNSAKLTSLNSRNQSNTKYTKSIENNETKNEETFKEENTKDLIYNKLIYSEKLLLFQTKFIDKIIEMYFYPCKITSGDKITKKLIMRNISFFIKFLKHNKELKYKR